MASAADRKPGRSETDRCELADLSALADGTLDSERRASVQARIAASLELSALYELERRAVEVLHEARAATRAPAPLRARIEAGRSTSAACRRRTAYRAAPAAAVALAVLALLLVLPHGTPGAPSVSQAAALAIRGPAAPAPMPDPGAPNVKLARSVEHVYFPNWFSELGWRAAAQRTDRIDGRLAVTVYYDWRGSRVAYTILGAPALPQPAAQTTMLNGTELRTLQLDGRLVVTWRRAGHTCVLSGAGVPPAVLQELAAWDAAGPQTRRAMAYPPGWARVAAA